MSTITTFQGNRIILSGKIWAPCVFNVYIEATPCSVTSFSYIRPNICLIFFQLFPFPRGWEKLLQVRDILKWLRALCLFSYKMNPVCAACDGWWITDGSWEPMHTSDCWMMKFFGEAHVGKIMWPIPNTLIVLSLADSVWVLLMSFPLCILLKQHNRTWNRPLSHQCWK